MANLLRLEKVRKEFTVGGIMSRGRKKQHIVAVNDISFSLNEGEILGLVGESGCGKTTIGKLIAGFYTPDEGQIFFTGKPLGTLTRQQRIKGIQMIFQDPFASINPKLSIGFQLAEAVRQGNRHLPMGRFEINENIKYYLDRVGLRKNVMDAYPHQFSGGELQRIIIARALSLQPKLIIADEPVSSLDLSIQAQILNLLKELKENFDLSYLFISHDLAVVNYMAQRVIVMKDGNIVEQGDMATVMVHPAHAYTAQLIEAVPKIPV